MIKEVLKKFHFIVLLKEKIYYFIGINYSKVNLIKTFRAFVPYSSGDYDSLAKLTINSVNSTFPAIVNFLDFFDNNRLKIIKLTTYANEFISSNDTKLLKDTFDYYQSDKASNHNYHLFYAKILNDREKIKNIFEVGLGSNDPKIPSNMGPKANPGASLRAFKDFLPNAKIFGADIDEKILFNEDRIQTYQVDQTKFETFQNLIPDLPRNFDLIIDDGLHSPDANINTLRFGLQIVKIGGWIVIEDIGDAALSIWQVIANLLPDNFEAHIFSCDGGAYGANLFAVKRNY